MLKYLSSNIYCSQFRQHSAAILFFCIFVIWQLWGIFPLTSYEGDAISISAGCEYTYLNGWDSLGQKGYGYWMQPLIYVLILLCKNIVPALSCETIYCGLSAIAGIVFQILVLKFAYGFCKDFGYKLLLLSLVLIPESYALAMYPNSTVFCACFFTGGLCLLQSRRILLAFILLIVAPFFRLDVLILYPLIPFLLVFEGMSIRRSGLLSVLLAVMVAPTTLLGFRMLGADIFRTITEYAKWTEIITVKKNLLAILGFYGIISCVLIPIGWLICICHKNLKVIVICTLAIILVHGFNFKFGNASKHFALLLPFVVILAAYGLKLLLQSKHRIISLITAVAIFLVFTVGVRIAGHSRSFTQSKLNDYAPVLARYDFTKDDIQLNFVIGGGQAFTTSDEVILSSGWFFYPGLIHNIKKMNIERNNAFRRFADTIRGQHPTILYTSWENQAHLDYMERTGVIHWGLSLLDSVFAELICDGDVKSFIDNDFSKYVRDEYQPAHRKIYFFSTDVICHRWDNMLEMLSNAGRIAPLDSVGAIYELKY